MNLLPSLRAWVYDTVITGMTATWYAAVLRRLAPGSVVLDVGIGTGAALLAHRQLVLDRSLRVTGIDIDAAYVARCRAQIAELGLEPLVEVHLESVYDHSGGPYDAVYFSGSFMLLPDPAAAVRHVAKCLRPDGLLYFTQTFEHRPSRLLEVVKPLLRLVTTIDFGRVTYEEEFRQALASAEVEILETSTIDAGVQRSAVLVIARPAPIRRTPARPSIEAPVEQ